MNWDTVTFFSKALPRSVCKKQKSNNRRKKKKEEIFKVTSAQYSSNNGKN